jgi:hypothetical protein
MRKTPEKTKNGQKYALTSLMTPLTKAASLGEGVGQWGDSSSN